MQDTKYGIGWLEKLKRRRAERAAEQAAIPKPPSLKERLEAWYTGLPDDDKRRVYTMREFRAIFDETPQKIGAALFELGWTRKRLWSDDRPTARYWFKV